MNPGLHAPGPAANPPRRGERSRPMALVCAPIHAGEHGYGQQIKGSARRSSALRARPYMAGPPEAWTVITRAPRSLADLKLHDIPNTVAGAVRSAATLGARMITLHASGRSGMLAAARSALDGVADAPELLAVTVLTSMDSDQMSAVGVDRTAGLQVELLARVGVDAGIRGFVCSPKEVASLRALTGPEGVLVIPGIRPAGAELGDQKRIATPTEALRQGASYLVVGRPITQLRPIRRKPPKRF